MSSRIGWIELSSAAMRSMRQDLLDPGDGVVDEMGVLALHSGYADLFFPGTSVLHTRARYLLFACWNFIHLANEKVSARSFVQQKERAELWITAQLKKTAQAGVIGGRVYPNPPAQPIDFIYWTALNTFHLYRGPGRASLARLWNPELVTWLSPGRVIAERDDVVDSQPLAQFLVPQPLGFWQQSRPRHDLTFELTRPEAEFLAERLQSLDRGCILSECARRLRTNGPTAGTLWEDPLVELAADDLGIGGAVERAELASHAAMLVRAVYAALVEKVRASTVSKEAGDEGTGYREQLLELWTRDRVVFDATAKLDLAAIGEEIPTFSSAPVARALAHLQERSRRIRKTHDVDNLLLDGATEQLFAAIETRRKGSRARLPRTPAGRDRRSTFKEGTIAVDRLHYRWQQVSRSLQDIREGLLR